MRRKWTKDVRALLTLAALIASQSCLSDIQDFTVEKDSPVKVGFYAGGRSETRTHMMPNGLSAEWESGDEVAVWAKNSSGSYLLTNQIFKTYGLDGQRGFFTSELASAMPDGTYTYMCCYPVPESVAGTKATFLIPSQQDGKVSGGSDVMIATPVKHGALAPIPESEDHSGMSMRMNRMLHQFRFWMPQGANTLGEDLEQIIVSMPQNIAGTMTADVADPSAAVTLENGVKEITLNLSEPIGESADFDDASFACVSVFPYDGKYSASDFMNVVLYSKRYKSTLAPISLAGRTFAAGHSTPVILRPETVEEYYRLTMKVGDNLIGEPLANVTIAFNGSPWYTYTNTSEEGAGNFVHSVEALGVDGKAAYDLIINSIESGSATYIYETEHALVNRPLTADMMKYDGNRIVLDLGDVPYLIYEDFTNAKHTAHDDDYSGTSDTNLGGYVLDGYMPVNGWNASRFYIVEGEYVRINCRYEAAVLTYAKYCGRLDTPALKYLKEGASVDVRLEFDYEFNVPAGYNMNDSSEPVSMYYIGTHTTSESSSIKGIKGNAVDDDAMGFGPFTPGTIADMKSASVMLPSVGASTRIAFFVSTTRGQSDVNFLGNNSNYYLYLDNIKVYINN